MRSIERNVVAVCTLLACAGMLACGASCGHPRKDGPVSRAQRDIDAFGTALKLYRIDQGRFPTTAQGLEALTEPTDKWPHGYLDAFDTTDPWGNSYVYTSDGETFLLVSYGEDGVEGGEGSEADLRAEDAGDAE